MSGHLLSNAIKYGYGGSTVRINVEKKDDGIFVTITNKGIAFPTGSEARNIWDFGVRGEKAKALHVNGSGIGLYTVRKVVNAHAGAVWHEAFPDEINKVIIRLPFRGVMLSRLGLLI